MSVYIRAYQALLPDVFEQRVISELKNIQGRFGKLSIPKNHKFYPEKSDSKIMRIDVIAAIIAIQTLLEQVGLDNNSLEKVGLFVANGAFLEEENRNIKRVMKTFEKIKTMEDDVEKLKYAFRSVPPLTALETLTNSAMSFIAKYAGTKGNNATYGNTSYSAYAALVDAIHDVHSGTTHALVGGANGSGVFSALAHINFYDSCTNWTESENSAFVLLQNNKTNAVAEIVKYQINASVPSLFGINKKRNWASFFNGQTPEYLIYSGGFTPEEFDANRQEVLQISNHVFSWNDTHGNLGASSLIASIIKGVDRIRKGKHSVVDIVDRDPYGRETYLQITNIK